mmetsp:Transcript_147222/g.257181  ORF Transcript_147222/g.257181 Transcript_147222/m.257181 type:complete len:83 (+) Transcript_147222:132-380(+)
MLRQASCVAAERPKAATWTGSVSMVVHAMAVAGCLGHKDGFGSGHLAFWHPCGLGPKISQSAQTPEKPVNRDLLENLARTTW